MGCRNTGLCGMGDDCPFSDDCEDIDFRLMEEPDSPWYCVNHPDNIREVNKTEPRMEVDWPNINHEWQVHFEPIEDEV